MASKSFAVNPSPVFGEGLTFIEQLHALSLQLCSNHQVPWLSGIKGKDLILMRGACKMWSCPTCGARNGRQWLAKILDHMNKNKGSGRWFFLTITAHPNAKTAKSSLKNIRVGWKKLYNRMRRRYGVSEYVKVWEFHKDNRFHLHILIRRKIGKKWLKDNSAECGMGFMCDSSSAKNPGQVAGYCAKYLLKSFEFADMYEKGMRRIECSRNWSQLPELESDVEAWHVYKSRIEQDNFSNMLAARRGYAIVDLRPSEKKVNKIIYLNDS